MHEYNRIEKIQSGSEDQQFYIRDTLRLELFRVKYDVRAGVLILIKINYFQRSFVQIINFIGERLSLTRV